MTAHAQALTAVPTHYCPQCGAAYYGEQQCDDCPDVRTIPLPAAKPASNAPVFGAHFRCPYHAGIACPCDGRGLCLEAV